MTPTEPHPTPPGLGPVLEFLRLLWRVDHALQKRSKRMGKELGVTGPQRLVLRLLGRFPGLPAGELATLLHLHPSTLSGILARLESGGLIRRRTDPRDGRRALFGLTERGRTLDSEHAATAEAAVARTLGRHDERTLELLRTLLAELAVELEGRAER